MKRLSKKDKNSVCYLCGIEKHIIGVLTRDHVFPDGLFPHPKPTNLLTLPCCEACQKSFRLDEEYFRNRLATSASVYSTPDGNVLWERVLQSFRRTKAMHQDMINSLIKVELKTPAGIYLGETGGFKIDKKRFDNVLKKMVRGLHYYHTGKVVTADYDVFVYFDPKDPLKDELKYIKFGQNFGDVIAYRGAVSETNDSSIWWVLFYKSHLAVGLVIKEGNKAGG